MRSLRHAFLFVALAGLAPAASQVLAPPLLNGQLEIAQSLVRVFSDKDLAGYSALLDPDVQVFQDGTLVARGKEEWLKRFGPKLTASGVVFKLAPGYASTGRILFIEYFNSLASWGRSPPPHCCWGYDAVAYDIAGGKIRTIRRLRGGNMRLDASGREATN